MEHAANATTNVTNTWTDELGQTHSSEKWTSDLNVLGVHDGHSGAFNKETGQTITTASTCRAPTWTPQ